MSAAAPTLDGAGAPAKKGKKKLIVIIAMVLLLVAVGGGAAMFLLKKKAPADGDAGDDAVAESSSHASDKPDLKHPPTFLPLDPFVVNLSDKDADRYAQVGITFEVSDAHFADEMKAFMPAIRNGILMILSHKSAKDLLDTPGKQQLAKEILRDASQTMGIEVEDDDDDANANADDTKPAADAPKPKKKKKRRHAAEPNPIKHVHFSNFIVQ